MSLDIEQRIRDRAYAIWQAEGCPDGRNTDHWLQAELAVRTEATGIPDRAPVVAVMKAPRKTTNAKPAAAKAEAMESMAAEVVAAEPVKLRKPRARKVDIP
ncbi:hypothetical protein VY88_01290 [Azospirillum thiophilum]|uniref:DUF2934 domain-containing protein n=1 Tax=Azospirillum thiophilum TaxID=528244 RepID=A0AAC8VY93_9PROT|nr:DUF2934 domain-containing protein [Azospirillum thiophilum]ALG71421.1 hypothetical protein AL072_11420 [Azospirillum thiophilum]KJR64929.1 hypothetical protein VY88_01290 [Azospirillum thiophilum]